MYKQTQLPFNNFKHYYRWGHIKVIFMCGYATLIYVVFTLL
jgi:hypothetical protein